MQHLVLRPALFTLIFLFAFPQSRPDAIQRAAKPGADAWQRLLEFKDKDLHALGETSRKELVSILKSFSPRWDKQVPTFHEEGATPPFHTPRYLWKLSPPDTPARYVLFGADGLFIIPGDSRAEAYVFDENGTLLSYEEFSLGWRAQFEAVKLITDSPLNVPLIAVITDRVDLGSPEYFGLIDNHLAMLRLDNDGKAVRNKFVANNWIIGAEPPKRSAEEWEQALFSNDPLELLRTLGWIGGKHWDLKIPPINWGNGHVTPSPDVKQNAKLVVSVRSRIVVRARMTELSKSENPWIREAAELALQPHDGDTSFCCGYASQ